MYRNYSLHFSKTRTMKLFKINLISFFFIFSSFFVVSQPKMILVEGGSFSMGNSYTDKERMGGDDEKPVHKVTLSSFYIGVHEVTVKEYKEFCNAASHKMPPAPNKKWMESHIATKKHYPSPAKKWWGWNPNFPMHKVAWEDAIEYCNWLSGKAGLEKCYTKNEDFGWDLNLSKKGYRLPTEAEWEFAARGGNKTKGYRYSGSNNVKEVAWVDVTTELVGPKKVKTKKPNELGIYDMCGNVWEWCSDYYHSGYYKFSPGKNPFYSVSQPYRVLRGGSWHYRAEYATVTSRDGPKPGFSNYNYGFRLVRTK